MKLKKSSTASSDGEEEELKQQVVVDIVWCELETPDMRMMQTDRSRPRTVSWSKWHTENGGRWLTHVSAIRSTRSWPKNCTRPVGWSSFRCTGKENFNVETDVAARSLERLERDELPARRRGARNKGPKRPSLSTPKS